MTKPVQILFAICLLIALAACGPSPEQQAAMTATAMTATAAAWTPTPTATNTPTPTLTPTATPTLTPTNTPTITTTPTITPDPNRYYADNNAYSLVLPAGWTSSKIGAYPTLINKDLTNIVVLMEMQSSFPYDYLVDGFKQTLAQKYTNVKEISGDLLATDEGNEYYRWVAECTSSGGKIRQTYYMFRSGDWTLFVVATRAASSGAESDAQLDAAINTMRYNHETD